jgi:hypothetical protein
MILKIILCKVEKFTTWTSPLLVELSNNVRVSGRKWELGHGNHLAWKIKGKVAKIAYSFCLLVILWEEEQKSAGISYSFIVLYPFLRTVLTLLSALLVRSDSGGKFC